MNSDPTDYWFLQNHPFFLQLSGDFDSIRLYNSRGLCILMVIVDGGLDEGVNVKGRASIRAAIMIFDLFYFILFGIDPPPK